MTAAPMSGDGVDRLPPKYAPMAVPIAAKHVLWCIFFVVISGALIAHTPRAWIQIAWLLGDLAAVGLFLRYQSQFINIVLSNGVFVSWPLLACASAAWSVSPELSLTHGLQLLMTMLIAFLLCIQFRLEQFVVVLFWALLIAAIATLASEVLMPYANLEAEWRGGFPHKNLMGDTMTLLVLTASCLFLQGRWRVITLMSIALALFLLFMSRSATATVSLFICLAPLPFAYTRLRGAGTFMCVLGGTLVITALAMVGCYIAIAYFGVDPIDLVLDLVGKDRTLTGRTLLWDMAELAIDSKPWLGFGFKGYWADRPAEMLQLLSAFGLQQVPYFHNNYLEVAVAFGVIGPVLLVLGIFIALWRTARRAISATQVIDVWPLLIVIATIIKTFVENPLFWNHGLWQVLFIVAAVIRR